MEKTDEELAVLVKSGDESAIEELFLRYKPVLNQICNNFFILGAEKDDVMQEAMIGLYKACMSFNESVASFYTFANVCIKRKVLDAIKAANSKKSQMLSQSLPIAFDDEEQNSNLPCDKNAFQELIEKENFDELKKYIFDVLSDFELLVLKNYVQGLSYQEIAQKLEKPVKSVDNAVARIKQKLENLKD